MDIDTTTPQSHELISRLRSRAHPRRRPQGGRRHDQPRRAAGVAHRSAGEAEPPRGRGVFAPRAGLGARRAAAVVTAYESDKSIHAAGFLTVTDAAERLGVIRLTVDKMIADGRLRAVRRGRRWVTTQEWVAGAHRGHRPQRRVPVGMLTVSEAAERAGVHTGTVRKAIRDGRLPAVAPAWPNGYGIRPEDLDAWALHARKPNTAAATRARPPRAGAGRTGGCP